LKEHANSTKPIASKMWVQEFQYLKEGEISFIEDIIGVVAQQN
jgi:hypothetical protein